MSYYLFFAKKYSIIDTLECNKIRINTRTKKYD